MFDWYTKTFKVKDSLTKEEIDQGLDAILMHGLSSQAMGTFTGGAFLVAFALLLGASNFVIGLIAAIGPIMNLMQIPSIYFVEKAHNRRAVSVYAGLIHRFCLLLMALIPFFFLSRGMSLFLLVITLILQGAFMSILTCAWNSWMRDLVPEEQLGSYFSKRMKYSTALGIPMSLGAGWYIDYFIREFPKYELYGYSTLFFLGFLSGMGGVYYLSITKESKMVSQFQKFDFVKLIKPPFVDENYRKLLYFLGSWQFAINLSAPFFTVYMLKKLGLSMSMIMAYSVLSQLLYMLSLRMWGKLTDHFSNKSVLAISGPLFMFCILGWTFTANPDTYWLTMPLLIILHIMMGISTAGVNLSAGNIALKLAPKKHATSYLAVNSLVNSVAAAIAPILGGSFADFFARRELSLIVKWKSPVRVLTFQTLDFQYWDFFFLFSFFIGLYALHTLARVREVGEVGEKVVLTELFHEIAYSMRNLSTAAGLRQLLGFPFAILKYATGGVVIRRRKKKHEDD